jgi:hypothetical protein
VPIDVAVEEPRAGVIGKEANCDNIAKYTHIHDIPDNGVVEIVRRAASATHDVEVVPVQMNRMLLKEVIVINLTMFHCRSKILTGPPRTPAGMVSSTLLLRSRPYMLPAGTSCDAFFAPLRIWSNTGTEGGSKLTSLTRKAVRREF